MKKNILIDLYKIKDYHSGLGEFSFNFHQNISQKYKYEFNISFLVPSTYKLQNSELISNIIHSNWKNRYFPNGNTGYDIWHSLHQFPSHFPNKKTSHILTIHDLNFLKEKNHSKALKYKKRLQKNIDRADIITCISKFTKSEVEQHMDISNKELQVIHNGVHLSRHDIPKNNGKPFFFSIGVFKSRKNFDKIVEMMQYFPNHKLILAGNNETALGQKIRSIIQSKNLENNIILTGQIGAKKKYEYYQNCEAFLFPSEAEGFGLPVIEAMLCGKPVFISKACSLPEIAGDKAFYWDSLNATDMAHVVRTKLKLFHSDSIRMSDVIQQHAQQYNWEKCIDSYVQLYR